MGTKTVMPAQDFLGFVLYVIFWALQVLIFGIAAHLREMESSAEREEEVEEDDEADKEEEIDGVRDRDKEFVRHLNP